MFLQYFDPFVIVACVTFNSEANGYIQDELVDRIFDCVKK